MHVSYLLGLGAATLAAAAPASTAKKTNNFKVSNFVYGCSVGCDWNFDLAVTSSGSSSHHPAVKTPVHCSGNLENTDYVDCGKVSDTQSLRAYIVKADNTLKLEYEVSFPEEGSRYNYFGETKVYAATSEQAVLQKANFKVPETSAAAVA